MKIGTGVVLVLLAWMAFPVQLEIQKTQRWKVTLCLLKWIRIPLFPRPPKKKSRGTSPKPQSAAAAPKKKKTPKPLEFWVDLLELINDLLMELGTSIGFWLRHLTVARCQIAFSVAGDDAEQTGVRYGQAQAVMGTLYAVLNRAGIRFRNPQIQIQPLFWQTTEEPFTAELWFRMPTIFLLSGAVSFLVRGGMEAVHHPAVQKLLETKFKT